HHRAVAPVDVRARRLHRRAVRELDRDRREAVLVGRRARAALLALGEDAARPRVLDPHEEELAGDHLPREGPHPGRAAGGELDGIASAFEVARLRAVRLDAELGELRAAIGLAEASGVLEALELHVAVAESALAKGDVGALPVVIAERDAARGDARAAT